jgi:DNA-binding protein HU-beta
MAGIADVTKAVAAQTGMTQAAAREAIDAVIDTISSLAAGETVSLRGFGTFKTKQYAAREGRNPQTGEAIKIKAKSKLTFKASK